MDTLIPGWSTDNHDFASGLLMEVAYKEVFWDKIEGLLQPCFDMGVQDVEYYYENHENGAIPALVEKTSKQMASRLIRALGEKLDLAGFAPILSASDSKAMLKTRIQEGLQEGFSEMIFNVAFEFENGAAVASREDVDVNANLSYLADMVEQELDRP